MISTFAPGELAWRFQAVVTSARSYRSVAISKRPASFFGTLALSDAR
jgi:hypothetical protein